MTLRNDGVQIRAEVPSGLSGDVDPLRGRRLGPLRGRGRTTVSSTQETPLPMPSDRTAAAVPDDERLPGDHSSTGPTTLFGSLLGYADARRDRLVGTVDGIDGVVGDPDDEVEPRGLVLRPALLGFVAVLAVSIGASMPSSPFKLEMPGVWFFGEPSTATPRYSACAGESVVNFTPILSRCRRATSSSSFFGSV